MWTTFVVGARSIIGIIATTSCSQFRFLLFLLGTAIKFGLGVFLVHVHVHAIDIIKTKSCGEDCHLHLLTQFWVSAKSPLYLKVIIKLSHEVIDIIHLIHHQTRVVILLIAEVDAEKYLARIEYIIVIEQW